MAHVFNFTSAKASATCTMNQHAVVSCDNTQVYIFVNKCGGMEVLSRLSIASSHGKLAMYPVPTECLGSNDCYLKPLDQLPCNAHLARAFMTPAVNVDIPAEPNKPACHSPNGHGRDSSANAGSTYGGPDITLPPGTCIEDSEGKKMTFKTASLAATDAKIDEMVANGTFRSKEDYRLAMRDAAWKELKRQLKLSNVKMSHIFECSGDLLDEDGDEVVSPEAMAIFMDLLYPCLIPGHDMVVCLPPLVGDELVMKATFSLRFSFPSSCVKIPLLGTYHSGTADPASGVLLAENLFIMSNVSIDLLLPDDETGTLVEVPLHGAGDFLSALYELRNFGSSSDADVESKYTAVIRGGNTPDLYAWERACQRFQATCVHAIFSSVKQAVSSTDFLEFSTESMFATNLLGRRIPTATTCAITSTTRSQASASAIVKRMAGKRGAALATEVGGSFWKKNRAAVADVNAILGQAVAELRDVGEAGTQAIVVHMARGQNPKYVTSDALVVDSVDFAAMTVDHKAQMTQMIKSLLK